MGLIRSYWVPLVGLVLAVMPRVPFNSQKSLPSPPMCWNCRHVPQSPAFFVFLTTFISTLIFTVFFHVRLMDLVAFLFLFSESRRLDRYTPHCCLHSPLQETVCEQPLLTLSGSLQTSPYRLCRRTSGTQRPWPHCSLAPLMESMWFSGSRTKA